MEKEEIKNVGDYIANGLKNIKDFDYRWSSLISSRPLLFEDSDYFYVSQYVKNECTQEEIEAYKSGKLSVLYASLDNLLMCNLPLYDRIISFCTMVFLHYVRLSNGDKYNKGLDSIPMYLELTPTKIWCCACCSNTSTEWELNYAWNYTKKHIIKNTLTDNLLKENYTYLYRNKIFAKFAEYSSLRVGISGFNSTRLSDKTSNRKLSTVCSKFTRTSIAVDEKQLNTVIDSMYNENQSITELYNALHKSLSDLNMQFAIFSFSNEFFIFTNKFKMRIVKDGDGKITKEYLSNNYECIVAESYLSTTIKQQINWARYKPNQNYFEKQVLTNMLTRMLENDFRNVKCIRKMNELKTYSEVTFTGVFGNVYAIEKFWFNDLLVNESRVCFSKGNMANYLVERGYYIFGTIHDIDVLFITDITRNKLVKHYSNYCIPILQHMNDVIMLNIKYRNEIIDVLVNGKINDALVSNKIQYTTVKSQQNKTLHKQIMSEIKTINKSSKLTNQPTKSYWEAIKTT